MKPIRILLIMFMLAACTSGDRLLAHIDDERAYTISYPVEWRRIDDSLTPVLGFPMLVAIATFDPPPGGVTCAHVPVNALDAVGPADILLTVHELPFGYALGPRPDDFRSRAASWETADVAECMQTDAERLRGGQYRYFEDDRTFDVILAMGPEVSTEDEAAAWAMLESFRPMPGSE